MKYRVPSAAALIALALTACQAKAPPAEAQAPAATDAVVAAAVSDVRSAAIDPATGKARDAGAAFTAPSETAAVVLPASTLGGVAPGGPGSTLDISTGASVPGSAESAN